MAKWLELVTSTCTNHLVCHYYLRDSPCLLTDGQTVFSVILFGLAWNIMSDITLKGNGTAYQKKK